MSSTGLCNGIRCTTIMFVALQVCASRYLRVLCTFKRNATHNTHTKTMIRVTNPRQNTHKKTRQSPRNTCYVPLFSQINSKGPFRTSGGWGLRRFRTQLIHRALLQTKRRSALLSLPRRFRIRLNEDRPTRVPLECHATSPVTLKEQRPPTTLAKSGSWRLCKNR